VRPAPWLVPVSLLGRLISRCLARSSWLATSGSRGWWWWVPHDQPTQQFLRGARRVGRHDDPAGFCELARLGIFSVAV